MQCKFRPTLHAERMIVERGISKSELVEAVLRGVKKIKNKKIIAVYRHIEVVYRKLPCEFIIITVY